MFPLSPALTQEQSNVNLYHDKNTQSHGILWRLFLTKRSTDITKKNNRPFEPVILFLYISIYIISILYKELFHWSIFQSSYQEIIEFLNSRNQATFFWSMRALQCRTK